MNLPFSLQREGFPFLQGWEITYNGYLIIFLLF
jgi:hypothetical protein